MLKVRSIDNYTPFTFLLIFVFSFLPFLLSQLNTSCFLKKFEYINV